MALPCNPIRTAPASTACDFSRFSVTRLVAVVASLFLCAVGSTGQADEAGFRAGVRFLSPTSAEIRWESEYSGPASVALGMTRKLDRVIESDETGPTHRVIVEELVPGETYFYRIGIKQDGKRRVSPFYEFDMRMNYAAPLLDSFESPLEDDVVRSVVSKLPHAGGFAVVSGENATDWAESLATHSDLTVVVCAEEQEVQRIRGQWQASGMYGVRLSAQTRDAIPDEIANLVVSEAKDSDAKINLLVPGGVCVSVGKPTDTLGWTELEDGVWFRIRAVPESVAEWGHQYGSSANLSYSGESLDGADEADEFEIRWLGKPGADFGIDRNPRMPAPLAVGGRVFHQGMNRMIALDAFNGTVLWSLEIPDLRRVNIPRDCANWCADRDHVYAAAHDRLWVIDAASGEMLHTLSLPEPFSGEHEWGYIAATDDMLIGSAVKGGSIYEEFWNKASWYDGKGEAATAKICADAIVAYDKQYGDVLWSHVMDAGVQSTITVVGEEVFFVETQDPELRKQASGKLSNSQIWPNATIVCLNRSTGEVKWRKPVAAQGDDQIIAFGLADDQQFVLQTSHGGNFHFAAYRRDNGDPLWTREVKWPSDNHGAHMQHAVLMGGKLFVQPHILDATNGEVLLSGTLGKRRGCATPIGFGETILYRGGTGPLSLWSLENESPTEFTRLRPSCWLSTIPAQGMLFSPEAGGGCSCGGWMECSIGFAPRKTSDVDSAADEKTNGVIQ